jgi:hypothetical protein
MMKEVAYYEGRDLVYPASPAKPFLAKNATVAEVRAYADALEAYETLAAEGKRLRAEYNDLMRARGAELMADLAAEYGLSEAKAGVLYSAAYEDAHSGGFGEVINKFSDLFDVVTAFNSAE